MSAPSYDPFMVEIEPGLTAGQCVTLEQCDYAIALMDEAIPRIVEQIAPYAGKSHTVIENEGLRNWLVSARMALRHKQRGKAALVSRRAALSRAEKAQRQKLQQSVILDVVKEQLPEKEMRRIIALARLREPSLWPAPKAEGADT